jgi:hypothetical protein
VPEIQFPVKAVHAMAWPHCWGVEDAAGTMILYPMNCFTKEVAKEVARQMNNNLTESSV